jgi:hypothetical protein
LEEALSVLPGITGLCQVVFRNEEEILREIKDPRFYESILLPAKLELDVFYVRNRNLTMDLHILVATVLEMMGLPAANWLVRKYGLECMNAVKLSRRDVRDAVEPRIERRATGIEQSVYR